MKYYVNEKCIGCGLCANMCPDVFEINQQGLAQAISKDVNEELIPLADNAMESCPVSAIEKE